MLLVEAPCEKCEYPRTESILRLPGMLELCVMVRFPYCIVIGKLQYLVVQCEQVVVEPEGSRSD